MTDPASGASSANNAIRVEDLRANYETYKDSSSEISKHTESASHSSLETLKDDLEHANPPSLKEHKITPFDQAKDKLLSIGTAIAKLWNSLIGLIKKEPAESANPLEYVISDEELQEALSSLPDVASDIESTTPPPSTPEVTTAKEPTRAEAFAAMQARRDNKKENELKGFLRQAGPGEAIFKARQAIATAPPEFKESLNNAANQLEALTEEASAYTEGRNTEKSDPDAMKVAIKDQIASLNRLVMDSKIAISNSRDSRAKEMKSFDRDLSMAQTQFTSKIDALNRRAQALAGKGLNSTEAMRNVDMAKGFVNAAIQKAGDAERKYINGEIGSVDQQAHLSEIEEAMTRLNGYINAANQLMDSLEKPKS